VQRLEQKSWRPNKNCLSHRLIRTQTCHWNSCVCTENCFYLLLKQHCNARKMWFRSPLNRVAGYSFEIIKVVLLTQKPFCL
jgi:hypothetical protein